MLKMNPFQLFTLDRMITNALEVVDATIVVMWTVMRQVRDSHSPFMIWSTIVSILTFFTDAVGAQTISEICRKTAQVWDGGLILKNSLFPTRYRVLSRFILKK